MLITYPHSFKFDIEDRFNLIIKLNSFTEHKFAILSVFMPKTMNSGVAFL